VVCDAGPLIHLDELGVLDLLEDFDTVLVPDAVWNEVQRHRPQATAASFLERVCAPPLTDSNALALAVAFSLDAGEAECLALMAFTAGAIFLCDDAAARLVAERLDHRVHGTIGVLLRAIRRGQRTVGNVLAILDELPARSSLHVHQSLLEEVKVRLRGTMQG
jgi:predicted nucleic acid-binding protein